MLKKVSFKLKNLFNRYISVVLNQNNLVSQQVIQKIGNNSKTIECKLHNPVSVGDNCFFYNIEVGAYTYLSNNVSVMNTVIGKFCSVGQGSGICLGKHPSNTFVSSSPVFFSPHKQCGETFSDNTYFREMGASKIGNDVWIGANAIIMDDITVGDGAIIGAGAIVTNDVPPYSIVVGCPGKVIKYRFTNEQIDFLLKFKWWNRDILWIRNNYKDFHDIKKFIEKYGNC